MDSDSKHSQTSQNNIKMVMEPIFDEDSISNTNESLATSLAEVLTINSKTKMKTIMKARPHDCYKISVTKKLKKKVKDRFIYKEKNIPIYFYETSSNPGAPIRDAITGEYWYGYKVGKVDHEELFYKTAYCVGDALRPGEKLCDNREPQFLYFSNPESYERHFKVMMSTERKEKWLTTYLKAKDRESRKRADYVKGDYHSANLQKTTIIK
tara:strand:+ start:2196 stop:2825 length:630 start_codon:yes stop_codon:yes gene_type:complete